jgi:glycosyltransferase involved in cell wall biosynthesis
MSWPSGARLRGKDWLHDRLDFVKNAERLLKMRVLHVNAGNIYGGVETLLATFARCRGLCPEMEPAFALCFEGRLSQELTEAGVPVHRLEEVRTSRFWTVLRSRRALRRLLSENAFDVVVTHMAWSHAIFGPEVRRAKIPLVNWVHGIPTGQSWLERWASRTPPRLAICNSYVTARTVRRLFDSAPSEVVYLPVAAPAELIPDRVAVRRQLSVSDDAVVILQVSRMEPGKGHQLHLEALAKLKDLPQWVCWIVGGAQCRQEQNYLAGLQRRTSELGISDRVRFLGQRSDVPSLMLASDVFCQPNSEPEGFGLVFIEALQAGLSVVSTNIGGAAEIIDQSCGVLTSPGDPVALADSLSRLIQSPAERRALGDAGPRRARALCDPAVQTRELFLKLSLAAGSPIRHVQE